MDDKARKVLDFLKNTETAEFTFEVSLVDKRDYSVLSYTYEMEPIDLPDFIGEHLSNPESLELKVSTNDEMVDLRFDSPTECTHICTFMSEEDGLTDLLKNLGLID